MKNDEVVAHKEYIEREAAIAVIEEKQKELCPVGMYSRHAVYGSDREKFDAWQEIIDRFENITAADVVPVRHGRWKPHSKVEYSVYHCSVCGGQALFAWGKQCKSDYCPNCGSRMDMDGDGE